MPKMEQLPTPNLDPSAIGSLPLYVVTGGPPPDTAGNRLLRQLQTYCPELEIRNEQIACLDAMQDRRDVGDPSILVEMAFGLGKTTVVAADAKRFVEERPGS